MQLFSISEFRTLYLHLCYGRQLAVPLASHCLLPPYVQSSVLACWLSFDQAGLSSLPTSASWRTYNFFYNQIVIINQKNRYFLEGRTMKIQREKSVQISSTYTLIFFSEN